jgi:micrococcal nuclease
MRDLIDYFELHLWNGKAVVSCDRKTLLFCIALGISISNIAFANGDVTGKVVAVIDGNTVEVLDNNKQTHKILLIGIDSPELEQEYGEKARKFLEKIILEENVIVQFKGKDRFGNRLAVVLINGKVDPRIELLKEGLAWTSEKNSFEDLESYRTLAQRKGRGLWKENNPVPPWTYRRQQTMMQPKSS